VATAAPTAAAVWWWWQAHADTLVIARRWVKGQAVSCSTQLWVDGVQQYQEFVSELLEEFKDIVGDGKHLC
jgi:hypothetical protein